MATITTTTAQAAPGWAPDNKQQATVEEDFMHGVNVASCHLKVRMGKASCVGTSPQQMLIYYAQAFFARSIAFSVYNFSLRARWLPFS
jgi:hypothetical protein